MNQEKSSFLRALKILFSRSIHGRIHFPKQYAGKILSMEDGKKFRVIRDLRVDEEEILAEAVAVFKVCFKFSGLPLAVNRRLSMIPAPFLMAKAGFLEKIWTVSDDGYFQGIYQWATKDYAESYPRSFIFKLMTKRSADGSLSHEIFPNTLISNYIDTLIK